MVAFRSSSSGTAAAVSTGVAPSALPTGWQVGDLLLAVCTGKNGAAWTGWDTLSGWNALTLQSNDNGANRYRMRPYWKHAQSGEGIPTFTTGGTTVARLNCMMFALSGAIYLTSSGGYQQGMGNPTPDGTSPTLTVAAQDMILVSAFGFSRGGTTTTVPGWTLQLNPDNGGVGGHESGLAYLANTAANPAGGVWNVTNGGDGQLYSFAFGNAVHQPFGTVAVQAVNRAAVI